MPANGAAGAQTPAAPAPASSPTTTSTTNTTTTTPTARTLIFGYGNPLRADDGVGPHIASHLEALFPNDPAIRIQSPFQLTPELALDITHASRVIFIDASVALPPGDYTISRLHPGNPPRSPLGHHLNPLELLALAATLAPGLKVEAWSIAVGVASLDMKEELSPLVARTAERLIKHIAYRLSSKSRRSPARDQRSCHPAAFATGIPAY